MLNRDKFLAVLDVVNARWDQVLKAAKPTYTGWAMVIPSTGPSNKYFWADLLVTIRKWVGERQFGQIKIYDWTVANDKFEGTFGEKVDNINDDQVGIILPKVDALLASAIHHPQNLLMQLMIDAYSTACFDGQYFIDTDHPHPSGNGSTWSNKDTAVLGYESLWTALEHFSTLTGPDGNPLAIEPYALVHGPGKQKEVAELLEMERNAAGATNTLRGRLKPLVNPKLVSSYAEYWQVLARPAAGGITEIPPASAGAPAITISGGITPYIYQQRETPQLVCTAANGQSLSGLVSQDLMQFLRDEVFFGTDFRGNATFTLPQLVYGSDGTNV